MYNNGIQQEQFERFGKGDVISVVRDEEAVTFEINGTGVGVFLDLSDTGSLHPTVILDGANVKITII